MTSSNTPLIMNGSYNLTCPLFSTMCLEWSAKGFTNMEVAHFIAIWLLWKQIPQQQHRHMQEKMQVKIMIPKISHFFSTKSP